MNLKVIFTSFIIGSLVIFLLFRFASSSYLQTFIINGGIFFFTATFGALLVKSVVEEVGRKNKLRRLSLELKELTDRLQEKVDEQTRDIKEAYSKEKESREELVKLNLVKDRFIVEAQHYLSSPLASIKSNIDAIVGTPAEVGEVLKLTLEKINSSVTRLDSLVEEFTNVVSGELTTVGGLNKKVVDVKDLLREIFEEFRKQASLKNIYLDASFPVRHEDNFLSADREKFKKALWNIIDNAIKYNKNYGSATVRVQRFIHPIERSEIFLRITIEDTGIGISKEEIKKLFISYFKRGEEAQKLYTTGRGIGLVVAKHIIEAHGGQLFVKSPGRGQGSMFFVEVPVE